MAAKFERHTVALACGCRPVFKISPPRPGENVYCRRHQDYVPAMNSKRNISVRCEDCKYSRAAGVGGKGALSRDDALDLATRHVNKPRNSTHTVMVTDSNGVSVKVWHEGQLEMPGVNTALVRAAENKAHGKSLRRW